MTFFSVANMDARQLGQYYTVGDPFDSSLFNEWSSRLRCQTWLEPFAGCGNLTYVHDKWKLYDIDPKRQDIEKRDTLISFPRGFKVVVTNPPYLARNSATRRKLDFPPCQYDDLYQYALSIMLKNVPFVAAIIPESFITSKHLKSRLWGVVSLEKPMFNDTACPVCLALFTPIRSDDFMIEKQGEVFKYNSLQRTLEGHPLDLTFNHNEGTLGLYACDSFKNKIRFVHASSLGDVKHSSRSITKIKGEFKDLESLIHDCNTVLNQWRLDTKDIFLTAFKGLNDEGRYRRRLDFKNARMIIEHVLKT